MARSPCRPCLAVAAKAVARSARMLREAANEKPIPSMSGRLLHVRASEREEIAAALSRCARE